ncbi:MAG: Rieske (2Fe-2S) protein [Parasphingorhabdus sp.]
MGSQAVHIEPVLNISHEERSFCEGQANHVDYDGLDRLHYLGNYQRELPVNIARMMENAHDWEHLPFVHPSAFSAIEKIDSGAWGWRTKVELPGSGETQLLQLLVDNEQNYWATTVLFGSGQGVHIHTQATSISDEKISVDVRFYLEEKPVSVEMATMTHGYLQALYAQLYDEDQVLMTGRQQALDRRSETAVTEMDTLELGLVEDLQQALPIVFDFQDNRYCLNQWKGEWVVYGATCPHLLGPLGDGTVGEDGSVSCPWHGYRFDIKSGRNLDGKCGDLPTPPQVEERSGYIIIKPC